MFVLVVFTDGIHYVCKARDVVRHKNTYIAKYKCKRYICRVVARHESFDVLDSIKKSLVADVPKIILHHISQPMCCKTSSPASQINENTQEIIINLISSNSSELNNENHVVDCNENIVNNIIKDKSTTVTINNTEHVSDHTEYMYGQNETENILIQEQIGLTTETECHITTDNIQHNTESLNEDIVQTNSANILWNWNGNTLQVYEAADTNILPCTTSKNTAETYRRVSTEDYIYNDTNSQNNSLKNVNDKDSSYIPSNNLSDESIIQTQINQTRLEIRKDVSTKDTNGCSLNVFSSSDISTLNGSEHLYNDANSQNDSLENTIDKNSSYIPSNNSSDENINETQINQTRSEIGKDVSTKERTNSSINVSSGLDISTSLNVSGKCARDDAEMFVLSTDAGKKKHFCMFCNTFQSKIARHLERVHAKELEVQKFTFLPKGTAERRQIIETLRRRGDFYFNVDNTRNDGELLVERRSKKMYNRVPSDYTACPKCRAFILKATRRHHSRKCIGPRNKDTRAVSVLGRTIIGRIHPEANSVLRLRVFPVLKEDDIVRLIRYDELIIAFGNQQCEKYKSSEHNDSMIRQKLRRVGRLLQILKQKCSEITDFASIYFPRYSSACIEAINTLAGLSLCGKYYKIPSLASSLGGLIKELGKILINRYIRKENYDKKLIAENFLKVFSEDYTTHITKTISETMNQNKRRKRIVLPSKSDIIRLHNFLQEKRQTAYNVLREKFSYEAWLTLAKVTLTSVQVFNRRRAGEIQRTLIEDYKVYEGINYQTNEMYEALSTHAKEIAKKYVRFTLKGKLGRTVPVLLTGELRDCIDMILKHRKAAKVSTKNPYLFGLPSLVKNKHRYLLACDLLRQYAVECGAENPETLRATELRKHIATMCINYNLSENEISSLANFMGHADKIHLTHYRQPVIEKEILEISQYLEAAQGVGRDEEDNSSDDNSDSECSESNRNNNDANDSDNVPEIHNDDTNNKDNQIIQDLQRNTSRDSDEFRISTEREISYSDNDAENEQNITNMEKQKNKKKKTKKKDKKELLSHTNHTRKIKWTESAKRVVLDAFGYYLEKKDAKLQGSEIAKLIKKHRDILGNRTVPTIRTWLHNQKRDKFKI
ncbi:uncharacterized protein LOC143896078 isoform X2 [Temnothorax americanus]|uniref:uncharacterized protein LOC143896078 isoform X2 n=1 Tax=Temnothorax americanus TaxID=1964332 RepID=UPI004067ACDA